MLRLISGNRYSSFAIFLLVLFATVPLMSGCGGKSQSDNGRGNSSGTANIEFPNEKAEMQTDDGVAIYGTYVYIDDAGHHPAVVLCHQMNKDRGSYAAFQNLLAENGICSLAIDFRGFGESTDDGLAYKNFKNQDYIDMVNDIKAAVKYMTEEPLNERIDSEKIGLVGASIGANLAIMASAELDGLKCAVALSPGRNYHDLKPIDYAPDVEVPVLIAYTQGDMQSADVISDLIDSFGENTPGVSVLDGDKHGTDMLPGGFDRELLDWIKEQLSN